jgi:hypothetical protein
MVASTPFFEISATSSAFKIGRIQSRNLSLIGGGFFSSSEYFNFGSYTALFLGLRSPKPVNLMNQEYNATEMPRFTRQETISAFNEASLVGCCDIKFSKVACLFEWKMIGSCTNFVIAHCLWVDL